MMTNSLAKLFVAGMVFQFILVPFALAVEDKFIDHTPPEKMLEFSLIRLKQSVRKTMQKNERLSFENDMLKRSVLELQRLKDDLAARKGEITGSYYPQKETIYQRQVDMEGRKKRTAQLIEIFERDVRELEVKINDLDELLSDGIFGSNRRMLEEKKGKIERSLIEAEKRLEGLEKRNAKPLEQIKRLQGEQNKLVREMKELHRNIGGY